MTEQVILIVEDDPVLRPTLQLMLRKVGYTSVVCGSGEEAVEWDLTKLRLIFMDIGLPGIDGMTATVRIRQREQQEGLPALPIVALTAHWDKERCTAAGMNDFLQKPAMMADLRGMVEKWCGS